VTDEEPPTHAEVKQRFDDEVSAKDVDEHFPEDSITLDR